MRFSKSKGQSIETNMSEERMPIKLKEEGHAQPKETAVYKRRWYVLGVFCYAAIMQATIWNTWGPITETTKVLLGWTDNNIALVTNLSNVSFCIMVIPGCMLMDRKGLRFVLLVCSVMLVIATGLRCITLDSKLLLGLAYACALINGMAAIVPFAGPSLVSAVWFPVNQRTTATAIASIFNYLGFAFSFLLGPLIVTNPEYLTCPNTPPNNQSQGSFTAPYSVTYLHDHGERPLNGSDIMAPECRYGKERNVVNNDELESGLRKLLFVNLGLAIFQLLLTLIYFPSRPPKPPSYTAAMEKPDYKQAGKQLVKNRNLWLVVVAGGLPLGVLSCWAAILDLNLGPIGVTQYDAGWIGFWHTIAGCISGLIVARFSDVFMRKKKLFLICLYAFSVASCVWFTLLYNDYIAFNLPSIYAACILLGTFANATIPLFYELSCDASYPVAEGVTGGFYTLVMNIFGTIFLFVLNIENIGVVWMNWALLGSFLICIPILIVFPEQLKRTYMDLYGP